MDDHIYNPKGWLIELTAEEYSVLYDCYALAAMTAILSTRNFDHHNNFDDMSILSYKQADSMMERRRALIEIYQQRKIEEIRKKKEEHQKKTENVSCMD